MVCDVAANFSAKTSVQINCFSYTRIFQLFQRFSNRKLFCFRCQAIGFYIYADRVSKKTFFFLPIESFFFSKLLNIVEYLSSGSFIDWQGHIYIFRIFWQFLHDYSNCNCLPWVIWKRAISFFSVRRYLHDHQSNIQNLEFSNKKLQFRGVNIVLSFLPFPSLCLFQQQFNFVCYSLMYILYWIKL